jgi:hypothetical protein
MGKAGIEGIYPMISVRLLAMISYSLEEDEFSLEVRSLKINGARGCFSSPADLIKEQQRWMKTMLSIYLVDCSDLIEEMTDSDAVELNSEKLSFASKAKV